MSGPNSQSHGIAIRNIEKTETEGAVRQIQQRVLKKDPKNRLDLKYRYHRPMYQAAIIWREMIRRMISLVPSRIWCTRRSRTIFSMP